MDRKLLVEQAARQAAALVDGVGSRALAEVAEFKGAGPAMLKALLTHELVAGHTVMMRLAAKVDHFLGLIADDRPAEEQDRGCRQAVQLSGAAARLGERYRLGLVSLDRLQRLGDIAPRRASRPEDPAVDVDDDPFDGGPGSGGRKSSAKQLAEFAALNKAMARVLDETTLTDTNEAGHDLGMSGRPSRGRLRHGNPSGDFLSAPRCGARTRLGCDCRQPAMANGRCRLHGGKSTGARTATGLARCRTTRLTHGERTAEIIDLRSAAARHGRALRILARAAKPQSERSTPCPATTPALVARTKKTTDEHGYARMNTDGASAGSRRDADASVFIRAHLRSSVAMLSLVKPNTQSERSTPCPAMSRWASAAAVA